MAGIRKNFDNALLAVFASIMLAFGSGLPGGQAVAATLPAPGLQEPQNLGRFAPGESFRQPLIVGVGTNELRLAGQGISPPSIRGFRGPIIDMSSGNTVFILRSITPSGVPTNGNFGLLITAPMRPGVYKIEYRTCRADGRPGWRSDMVYEVGKDGDDTGTDAQSESSAPRFGGTDAAPPLRFSAQWGSARTLGQDPPTKSAIDHAFGRGTVAVEVAPQTDLRIGLAGGLAKPTKDGSPYGWGDFVGPELSLARQIGDWQMAGGFRWMANSTFSGQWVDTPLALTGSIEATNWLSGWLRPTTELSLSPRHLGTLAQTTARITPQNWEAWLGVFGGVMAVVNLETSVPWARGELGLAAGLPTVLGEIEGQAGVAFAPSLPTSFIAGVAIRN